MTKLVSTMVVAMAVVFSACGGAAECTKDSDCKGTRVCNSGACVDSSSGLSGTGGGSSNNNSGTGGGSSNQSTSCFSGKDSDCPAGFWCNQKQCAATTKKKVGETCSENTDCAGSTCLVKRQTDVNGYCSKQCNSFSECPTFWSCEEIANGGGTRCVQK
ncbi:MAG: hypothetical protein GQE15_12695 [Archangiaceae bacterium]|nr:hypothetical protein [Archangiaceae bacterium]